MLAQAAMPVVIALTEKITLGTQECVTAEFRPKGNHGGAP